MRHSVGNPCLGLLAVLAPLVGCSALHGPARGGQGPAAAPLEAWRAGRFGMFVHWGPVALKGTEIGWSRGAEVPIDEYDSQRLRFAPARFDPDEWVSVAKAAGMKYLVLVTKHHDGFCMWNTRQTDFNIMNTPHGRDVVKAVADACRRQGLAFGTYHSVCDWRHPDFPLTSPGGKVERETHDLDRYDAYLRAQVKELIENYGPLITMWFDVPQRYDHVRGQSLIGYVRSLQPDILINDRTGGGGDYATPEQRVGGYDFERPWETCMTIATQWAWKPDDPVKSLKECLSVLVRCAGGDGNLLLNVGPTPDGRIEPLQVERLKEIGGWLERYGRSIYGTRGGPWTPTARLASTRRGRVIYLHVLEWSGSTLVLPPLPRRIIRSSLLTGGAAEVTQNDEGVKIIVPAEARNQPVTIVQLDLDGSAETIPAIPTSGRRATASNVYRGEEAYRADKADDGDPHTRWATDEGIRQAWLELEYLRPVTLVGARVREHYERIRKFELQVRTDGTWQTVATGTTVGRDFEQRFERVTARGIRLNILDATEGPSIDSFEPIEANE